MTARTDEIKTQRSTVSRDNSYEVVIDSNIPGMLERSSSVKVLSRHHLLREKRKNDDEMK